MKNNNVDKSRQDKERQFWDKYAKNYDSLSRRLNKIYDIILDDIRYHIDSSKDVLEVATGTGTIALGVAAKAKSVSACDISPKMIGFAKDKLSSTKHENVTFTVQDAYNLDYPDESFDVVIASNVLHVMILPEQALTSIKRVMKPNAILLAPTYCHGQTFTSRIVSCLMSLRGFKAYHRWSVPELLNFYETCEFIIADFKVIKGLIPLLQSVLRKEQDELT